MIERVHSTERVDKADWAGNSEESVYCPLLTFLSSFLLLPQWEMKTTSWVLASSRKPSPPILRSHYLTSCLNPRKATLWRTSLWISTAKPRPPRRFTSSVTASGSTRRTTLWRRGWTKTQVRTCLEQVPLDQRVIWYLLYCANTDSHPVFSYLQ